MATFLLFLTHLIDFPLVRIMGMSFWYALDMMLAESLGNFIELLYATHTTMIYWVLAGFATVLIPILGVVFFRIAHKLMDQYLQVHRGNESFCGSVFSFDFRY